MARTSKETDKVRPERGRKTAGCSTPAAQRTPKRRRTKMLQPAAQPYVGIDLHRRRSVIVQRSADGETISAT
jgi:hypothetical protein